MRDDADDDLRTGPDGFVFNVLHGELRDAAGARVALRPQATAVLQCLAGNAGHIVGKDELMRSVWRGVVVTDDSLVQCIKELRRVLGDTSHSVIQTEPKRGYRLVAATRAARGDDTSAPEADTSGRTSLPFQQASASRPAPTARASHTPPAATGQSRWSARRTG